MSESKFFREKPKEVEARLFDGDTDALMDVVAWAQAQGYVWFEPFTPAPSKGITINPASGFLGISSGGDLKFAEKGDWLYLDVDGLIKSAKASWFAATYEEIAPEASASPISPSVEPDPAQLPPIDASGVENE